jgi:hypothetical protein
MKKFIQSILFGYREDKAAKTVQGGSHITFEGGSPQERLNAGISFKNEVMKRKYRDWNIEQKEVIN